MVLKTSKTLGIFSKQSISTCCGFSIGTNMCKHQATNPILVLIALDGLIMVLFSQWMALVKYELNVFCYDVQSQLTPPIQPPISQRPFPYTTDFPTPFSTNHEIRASIYLIHSVLWDRYNSRQCSGDIFTKTHHVISGNDVADVGNLIRPTSNMRLFFTRDFRAINRHIPCWHSSQVPILSCNWTMVPISSALLCCLVTIWWYCLVIIWWYCLVTIWWYCLVTIWWYCLVTIWW